MVQKKAPDRYGSPAEPKGGHAKPERRLYSNQNQQQQHHHHRDGGGGDGGGVLRKMLNKSRSIKVLEESLDSPLGTQLVQLGNLPALKKKKKKRPSAVGLPNYMKSTSSSNAKKEQAQVSSPTPPSMAAGNRLRSPKSSPTPSDHLKKKGPSPGGTPGVKPGKLLARKSSLRAVRPPTKMVLGIPLFPPQINASRATCSSTMKETTFPDHLDLNPGATEAEGTSLFKVCPYTYCSLNGHRHAPLPPLKCFLSARRRLLKTQKSMKLRGLPSFWKTEPKKEETEIGAELGVSSSSLVEDPGDDFFVEIYAKCPTEPSAPVGGDEDDASTVAVHGTASAGDGEGDWDARIEENGSSSIGDSRSQISSDDVFDQISEFSPSEMEVLINFLEFVECDSEDECCFPADSDEFGGELAEEESACEPVAEAADLDWEEDDPGLYIDFDEIEYSEIAEDESNDGTIFALPNEGCEEDAEEIVAEDEGRTGSDETVEATTSTLEDTVGQKNKDELEKPFEEQRAEAVGPETGDLIAVSNKESTAADPCDEVPDTEDLFGIDKLFSHAKTHTFDTEEKQGKVGKDQNDEASIIEMETWESEEEEDESPVSEKDPDEDKLDGPSELSTDTSTAECPRAAAAITRAATSSVEEVGTDGWAMVIRKKAHGDAEEEQLRAFNPRDPNFLPVEPDPEAEKVDLRHQMMDERKNSEEWMVDYALRQAVDKLAPGRKRKVALLVEAFETVAPVPAYGPSLSHSTVEFAHPRPIQACS